jgi:hypothetical protein
MTYKNKQANNIVHVSANKAKLDPLEALPNNNNKKQQKKETLAICSK